jgi:threonine dehydrogenase-like Zn-dependent dehydrogenase
MRNAVGSSVAAAGRDHDRSQLARALARIYRGHTEARLTMNSEEPHAVEYAGMRPYQGGQAEFVLVPHADFNSLKLPGKRWQHQV